MTQTFGQLPQRNSRRSAKQTPSAGTLIALVLLFFNALIPRAWILGFWIFSYGLDEAFGSWIIPAVGFVIAPWTTLLYAWMWAIGSDAVHGWEWLPVAVGVLLDVWFLSVARRLLR